LAAQVLRFPCGCRCVGAPVAIDAGTVGQGRFVRGASLLALFLPGSAGFRDPNERTDRMIRHVVCTVSAAAALALTAAAPAVACDQPTSTVTPQTQQEHAKFADKGSFRHHHHHHLRGFDQQAQTRDQQAPDQQSFDGQHHVNCDHSGSDD
jgi:hypothetical protein